MVKFFNIALLIILLHSHHNKLDKYQVKLYLVSISSSYIRIHKRNSVPFMYRVTRRDSHFHLSI